ncbi:MAG TPA: hypothetical protein VIE43_23935 [Thermoanaerobaculia bacterium]|jgi:hypothetical protein|nr:hypothetical protein [Thermoanaerobaculia bacterium]
MPTVPRLTPDVFRRSYAKMAASSPYYVYEAGRDAIKGCALRVLRREVQGAGEGKHYRKGAVGDWRQRMSPADQDLFRRMAGRELARLGYSDEGKSA